MPSDQKLCREPIPFEMPQPTKEVPEGFVWTWQDDQLYQESTGFRLDESGWLIDPKDKGYVDVYTGWRYDANQDCLFDAATGQKYTMDREPIHELAGIRIYPGQAESGFELPANLVWDIEKGYATKPGHENLVYNPDSGWLVDPETNVFYEVTNCWAYDPTFNGLLDMATGKKYTMEYEEIAE